MKDGHLAWFPWFDCLDVALRKSLIGSATEGLSFVPSNRYLSGAPVDDNDTDKDRHTHDDESNGGETEHPS